MAAERDLLKRAPTGVQIVSTTTFPELYAQFAAGELDAVAQAEYFALDGRVIPSYGPDLALIDHHDLNPGQREESVFVVRDRSTRPARRGERVRETHAVPAAPDPLRARSRRLGGKTMRQPNDAIREHLVRVLDWEDAHVGFDKAVANVPPEARGARPLGFEHSVWQLLEHLRLAQEDILDFCVNAKYVHNLEWPDDYWPKAAAPPSDAAWDASIAEFIRSRERFQQLAREVGDLTASVPTGNAQQTYLRAILLAADHVAYHVGQIVAVRRALGRWN